MDERDQDMFEYTDRSLNDTELFLSNDSTNQLLNSNSNNDEEE